MRADFTVVVPTVPGRFDAMKRCLAAFRLQGKPHVVVVHGSPTCGDAWVEGGKRAEGDYICFAADDLEPHPGFCEAMIEAIDRGYHPAPKVLEVNGSLQSCGGRGWDVCRSNCADWTPVEWSPVPFMSRDHWKLIQPHSQTLADLHYASDMLVSAILSRHGVEAVVRTPAAVTHTNHQAGRGAGMEQHARVARDRAVYERYVESL